MFSYYSSICRQARRLSNLTIPLLLEEAMAQELPVAEKNHAALLLHYGIELPVSRTFIYCINERVNIHI